MPIYTFESDHSLEKIRGKTVVADSSYLIAYVDNISNIRNFHTDAVNSGTIFYINVVVRSEFIKAIRKAQLIEAILKIVQDPKNTALDQRYRDILGMPNAGFTAKNLSSSDNYNKIYKNHVRKGDLQILLNYLRGNIWQTVDKFEKDGKFSFLGSKQTSEIAEADETPGEKRKFSWENLSEVLEETCLNSSDAMIVNFALSVLADAIVTTDTDYAQVSDRITIFMTAKEADECAAYENADD